MTVGFSLDFLNRTILLWQWCSSPGCMFVPCMSSSRCNPRVSSPGQGQMRSPQALPLSYCKNTRHWHSWQLGSVPKNIGLLLPAGAHNKHATASGCSTNLRRKWRHKLSLLLLLQVTMIETHHNYPTFRARVNHEKILNIEALTYKAHTCAGVFHKIPLKSLTAPAGSRWEVWSRPCFETGRHQSPTRISAPGGIWFQGFQVSNETLRGESERELRTKNVTALYSVRFYGFTYQLGIWEELFEDSWTLRQDGMSWPSH